MQVLVACDKFKGSISAIELCDIIATELESFDNNISCIRQPLADGGDGTLSILQSVLALKKVRVKTVDALNRPIESYYLKSDQQAFIELAEASGIHRLKTNERNIMRTNTRGTGILIKHAIQNGYTDLVLSIGGSCSNDLGLGIAYELGFQFLDQQHNILIPSGGTLKDIAQIIPPNNLVDFNLTILCDVDNPLFGPLGAAQIYGPQKGATKADINILDQAMEKVSTLISTNFDKDVSTIKGTGAAGGTAAGLLGLLPNVTLVSGFDFLSDLLQIEAHVKQADLIISGEGQLDEHSFHGKVVGKLYDLCTKHNKPLSLIVGKSTVQPKANIKVFQVIEAAASIEDSFANTALYIKQICHKIYQTF